jgi:hypothetical protein
MEYEYNSFADSVPPERVGEYLAHVREASKALDYEVTWRLGFK